MQKTRYPINLSDSSPQGGYINGTADGLPQRKPQVTGNMRPVNYSLLLPPENQIIHKIPEGETKWKIGESNKDTTVQSARCGIMEKR